MRPKLIWDSDFQIAGPFVIIAIKQHAQDKDSVLNSSVF